MPCCDYIWNNEAINLLDHFWHYPPRVDNRHLHKKPKVNTKLVSFRNLGHCPKWTFTEIPKIFVTVSSDKILV